MSLETDPLILAPFQIEPAFDERIWGTPDLRPWYDHVTTAGETPIGEVWLTGDQCRVATGELAGRSLGEVFAENSEAMLGPGIPDWIEGQSPLLLKVLFAKEKLSVQVHPDDRLAQKYGFPRGKTECWYALAAEPEAAVAAGLLPSVTLDQIEAEVADGTLEKSLNVLPVVAGDMIFVDAGTVHAIWPGSVLLETQQNSDLTYRLFDYGRPRELHVAKAIEATRLKTAAGKIAPKVFADRTVLIESTYFSVEKVSVEGTRTGSSLQCAPGLQYLFAAAGSGRIEPAGAAKFDAVELPTRGVVAIPASSPAWEVVDVGGLELIRIAPRFPVAAEGGA